MYAKSISEFRKSGDSPHVIGHLGQCVCPRGQTDAARKTIARLEEHVRKDGVGEYEIAFRLCRPGQEERGVYMAGKIL